MSILYRPAIKAQDHAAICRIGKQTKWTKDVSNEMMFTSDLSYERGWIRVAEMGGGVIGFSCIREKVRAPEVVLYFLGVSEEARGIGIGWRMIQEFMGDTKHRLLVLNCALDNPIAFMFYQNKGFEVVGKNEKYHQMRRLFHVGQ